METDLKQIKTKLIEALQIGYIIFVIPALAASLLRINQTGWHWTYLVQIALTIMAVLMYLFRSKCSLAVKTHLSCIFFILVCFQGAVRLSISGAIYYCALAILIGVLLFGKRTGVIYSIVSITGLIIIALLHYYKIITTEVDFNIYNFSFTAWLNSLIALAFFMIMSILSIGLFYEYFNRSIATLIQKSKEQEIIRAELAVSEERYRLLINNTLIPISVTNYNGDIIFMNQAAEKLFKISINDSSNNSIVQFWNKTDQRDEYINELKSFGCCKNKEVEFRTPTGEILTLILDANIILYDQKTAILSVAHDITDQKATDIIRKKNEQLTFEKERAEISELNTKELLKQLTISKEAIELSEKRYKQAQVVGKTGSWELDLRTNIFWGSDEAKRIYGFKPDETTFNFEEVTKCVIDRTINDKALKNLLQENKPYNIIFDINPYDGSERKTIHSIAELLKDELDNPIKITGVIHDITERKKIEEALKESEERYRTIVENAMMGIIIRNEDKLLFINKALCKISGYTEDELSHMDNNMLLSTIHPNDQKRMIQQQSDRLAKKDNSQRYEMRRVTKDGKVIWLDVLTNNIKYGANEAQLGLFLDITERKQAEEELNRLNVELRELAKHLQTIREEERLAVAKEIHDELSQNLVAMNFNSVYLKNSIKEEDSKIKTVIEDQIAIASNLINKSRVIFNSLHPTILDEIGLLAAIDWYANNQLKDYKITVEIHSNAEDEIFPNDISFPLFRIFQEVIANVKLHSKAQKVTIDLFKENDTLSITIEDNGIGFDTKSIDVMNSHGLLGIRERVYAMNGHLLIKSTIGEGTIVNVTIDC